MDFYRYFYRYYSIHLYYSTLCWAGQRKRYVTKLALQVNGKDRDNVITGTGYTVYPYGKNEDGSQHHIIRYINSR